MAKSSKKKKKGKRKLHGAALAAHQARLARGGRKGKGKGKKKGHAHSRGRRMGRIESDYFSTLKRMREAGVIPHGGEHEIRVEGGRVVYGRKRVQSPFLMGHGRGPKGKKERALARKYAAETARNIRQAHIASEVDAIRMRNLVRQFGDAKAREIFAAQKERARLRTVTQHSR